MELDLDLDLENVPEFMAHIELLILAQKYSRIAHIIPEPIYNLLLILEGLTTNIVCNLRVKV